MSYTDTILCTADELRRMLSDLRLHKDRLEVRINDLQELDLRQANQITTLTAKVSELKDQVTDCESAHKSDISIIGAEILQVFAENDFCDIADRALDVLNEKISGKYPLPVRRSERMVAWEERIIVTISHTATFLSEDDDDAIEQAKEYDDGADTTAIMQAVTDGEYFLDECQNYEVVQ